MRDKFLIVLGDIGNRHFQSMYTKMQSLGDINKILDNVFVLITKDEIDYESIRNSISGDENGYCIVISMNSLTAAWNLTPANSQYLQSFFPRNNGIE